MAAISAISGLVLDMRLVGAFRSILVCNTFLSPSSTSVIVVCYGQFCRAVFPYYFRIGGGSMDYVYFFIILAGGGNTEVTASPRNAYLKWCSIWLSFVWWLSSFFSKTLAVRKEAKARAGAGLCPNGYPQLRRGAGIHARLWV
jgi:hypothetical protein